MAERGSGLTQTQSSTTATDQGVALNHSYLAINGIEFSHCCACTASAEHFDFDCSGCEFCDASVILTFDGKTVMMTSTRPNDVPEHRFTF
jgi:hypothetical protein